MRNVLQQLAWRETGKCTELVDEMRLIVVPRLERQLRPFGRIPRRLMRPQPPQYVMHALQAAPLARCQTQM